MLLFFDGCGEYYQTAQIDQVWDSAGGAPTVQGAAGRRGGAAIRFGAATHFVSKGFAPIQTIVAGFATQWDSMPTGDSTIATIWGQTATHCLVFLGADGSIGLKRFPTTLLASSAGGVFTSGQFHYIEFKVTISDTVGAVQIRIDGELVLNATGLDTNNGQADATTMLRLTGVSGRSIEIDDVYILDTTGPAPQNDFLGDIQVDALLPNGDGNSSQWTPEPDDPATLYDKVDEVPPNDDTDYLESATPNDKALFTFPALPVIVGGGIVFGVKAASRTRKSTTGTKSFRHVTRPETTDFSGDARVLQTDYRYHFQLWDKNPDGDAAWEEADVDGAEFGVEVL